MAIICLISVSFDTRCIRLNLFNFEDGEKLYRNVGETLIFMFNFDGTSRNSLRQITIVNYYILFIKIKIIIYLVRSR